jgi:hypothetical protein
MNRWIRAGVVFGLLTAPIGWSATAAGDPVATADKALMMAFEKGDKAALNKYLDADFTWIDREGVMVFRSDALALGMKPLVCQGEGIEIVEHPYGDQMVWLQAHRDKNFAARFWVKRPEGWRLLHTTEIAVLPGRGERVRPTYDIPCLNPCKQLPIHTTDKVQEAAMAGWQEQEGGRQFWLKHVADDNQTVSTYGGQTPPKKDRPNPPPPAPGAPVVGAAPVLFARLWTFGQETVVMVSCQPTYGEKAYWASRVFHYQHGTWQMAESYHNYVQASGVMTEVQGK